MLVELAERAGPNLTRAGRRSWLERLEEESGNLREALAAALWRFWQMRGHVREGRQLASQALGLDGGRGAGADRGPAGSRGHGVLAGGHGRCGGRL